MELPPEIEGFYQRDYDEARRLEEGYFPLELRDELAEAGFADAELLPVEGAGAAVPDFQARWADPRLRDKLLAAVRAVEREPWALDLSPHLLALARR